MAAGAIALRVSPRLRLAPRGDARVHLIVPTRHDIAANAILRPRKQWTSRCPNANSRRTVMTDLSLTILTEKPEDAAAIERLHERTFGPGRYVRTAYRIRERLGHQLDLSYTARIGTLLVGSV